MAVDRTCPGSERKSERCSAMPEASIAARTASPTLAPAPVATRVEDRWCPRKSPSFCCLLGFAGTGSIWCKRTRRVLHVSLQNLRFGSLFFRARKVVFVSCASGDAPHRASGLTACIAIHRDCLRGLRRALADVLVGSTLALHARRKLRRTPRLHRRVRELP